MSDPGYVLFILYLSSILELGSCLMILILFNNIKAEEFDNLRWIKTISTRRKKIGNKFTFELPDYFSEDQTKIYL